jgi:hypothetical protein
MVSFWNPSHRLEYNTVHLDDLQISFHQTVRVPDNNGSSALPPSLGLFPLYEVKSYANKLPDKMSAKGGLFLPLYREFPYP